MNRAELHHILSAGWDILLAAAPLAASLALPGQVSGWVGLVGIPLLVCRYQIIQLERQGRARGA